MRTAAWRAAFLGLGLAAVSQSVGAQAGPTLTPALRFDVASVRAIDNTALFDIDFTAAPVNGPASGPLAELPPILTAVEDQLGLKLQTGRGPVEALVTDRLEMPTEN